METFAEHVRRLQDARGWSQSRLISEASSYGTEGTAMETIRNAVTGRRGNGWPAMRAIEAVGRALSVDPMEFTVYRIQRARQRLDPELVGWASALASADVLLSQPIPEDVAEEAALLREGTPPSGAPSARQSPRKGQGV